MTWAVWIAGALTGCFLYWRFYFFLRDPQRRPPPGDHLILAPADGYVTYVKRVSRGEVPIAIKHRRAIPLTEIIATGMADEEGYLIGIFMSPFSVHRNRVPVSGEVILRAHRPAHKNISMVRMFVNVLVKRQPFEEDCGYLLQNERLTVGVKTASGVVVTVTQIADAWINRIVARVSVGDTVSRGQQYGLIRMGSQVDTFIPKSAVSQIAVTPGQRVRAGESVIAAGPRLQPLIDPAARSEESEPFAKANNSLDRPRAKQSVHPMGTGRDRPDQDEKCDESEEVVVVDQDRLDRAARIPRQRRLVRLESALLPARAHG